MKSKRRKWIIIYCGKREQSWLGTEEMHCLHLRLLGLDTIAREKQYAASEFSAIGPAFTLCTISISLALCDQLVLDLSDLKLWFLVLLQWNIVLVYQQGKFWITGVAKQHALNRTVWIKNKSYCKNILSTLRKALCLQTSCVLTPFASSTLKLASFY